MSEERYRAQLSSALAVCVCLGDLTVEKVDAIVNAANTHLAHGGGLAGAIVRAGGEAIQEESDAVAPVQTGHAVATGAGVLPCRRVIHAVGPIWSKYVPEEADRLLSSAVTSSLAIAHGEGLESISIPAISSGIFGFPKDRCARVMFDAVQAFHESHPDTSLRQINLTNFDSPTVNLFEAEARRRYD